MKTTPLFWLQALNQRQLKIIKDTGITITGSGFSGIGDIRAKLGAWEDDKRDATDDSALPTNVSVVDDTTITATVPAGTHMLKTTRV